MEMDETEVDDCDIIHHRHNIAKGEASEATKRLSRTDAHSDCSLCKSSALVGCFEIQPRYRHL